MATWQDDARCLTVGVTPFFPDDEDGNARNGIYDAAKAVCDHCTVRTVCLETALAYEGATDVGRRAGVWGGTTPSERATIARQRAAATNRPGDIHAPAIHDLTRAGHNPTTISRRLGIDPRTVNSVLERTAPGNELPAAA